MPSEAAMGDKGTTMAEWGHLVFRFTPALHFCVGFL